MSGTRPRILAAARDLLLEKGVSGMSMREVASRVGVSATAIYRHFDQKRDLLAAVVAEGSEIFRRTLGRALRGATPQERLLLTGKLYLRFAFENPQYYAMLFMASEKLGLLEVPGPPEGQLPPSLQFLVDRVVECREEGLIDPRGGPMQVAILCWALVHGLASLWLTGGGRARMPLAAYRKLSEEVLERALEGILSTARRPAGSSLP